MKFWAYEGGAGLLPREENRKKCEEKKGLFTDTPPHLREAIFVKRMMVREGQKVRVPRAPLL